MSTCCGGSLQTGTKIIAILEMVSSILFLVLICGALFLTAGASSLVTAGKDDHVHMSYERSGLAAVVGAVNINVIVYIVVGILSIILSALLLSGANKRNRTRCMIWFVVHAIFLLLSLVGTLWAVFSEGEGTVSEIAGIITWNLIYAYFLWVVWAFMSEIKNEGVEVEFQVPRIGRVGPQTWA